MLYYYKRLEKIINNVISREFLIRHFIPFIIFFHCYTVTPYFNVKHIQYFEIMKIFEQI